MDFSRLFQRANLSALQCYLLFGCESAEEPPAKSYSERLKEARDKVNDFFTARYPDNDEFDEITGYVSEQMAVIEEVYFEIGFILGAKIAVQICEKIKKLA